MRRMVIELNKFHALALWRAQIDDALNAVLLMVVRSRVLDRLLRTEVHLCLPRAPRQQPGLAAAAARAR